MKEAVRVWAIVGEGGKEERGYGMTGGGVGGVLMHEDEHGGDDGVIKPLGTSEGGGGF